MRATLPLQQLRKLCRRASGDLHQALIPNLVFHFTNWRHARIWNLRRSKANAGRAGRASLALAPARERALPTAFFGRNNKTEFVPDPSQPPESDCQCYRRKEKPRGQSDPDPDRSDSENEGGHVSDWNGAKPIENKGQEHGSLDVGQSSQPAHGGHLDTISNLKRAGHEQQTRGHSDYGRIAVECVRNRGSEHGVDERKNQHDHPGEAHSAKTNDPYQIMVPGTNRLTYPHTNRLRDTERKHKCRRRTGDRDLVGGERRRADPSHQNRGERESPYFG